MKQKLNSLWIFSWWYLEKMRCLKCGRESKYTFCRWCKNIKRNATSIVSQNKNKLRKLLLVNNYNTERFDKFNLYSNNIKDYGRIVLEYKSVKNNYIFEKILKYWTIINCCVCAFFGMELLLIS